MITSWEERQGNALRWPVMMDIGACSAQGNVGNVSKRNVNTMMVRAWKVWDVKKDTGAGKLGNITVIGDVVRGVKAVSVIQQLEYAM